MMNNNYECEFYNTFKYELDEKCRRDYERILNIKTNEEVDISDIDKNLDIYNDYMTLYAMFGDIEYKITAMKAMGKINRLYS